MRKYTENKVKTTEYKNYTLYEIDGGGVVWSHSEVWMGCSFDTVDTAKYCIDKTDDISKVDNFFTAISIIRKVAIDKNDGLVTKEMIDNFIENK